MLLFYLRYSAGQYNGNSRDQDNRHAQKIAPSSGGTASSSHEKETDVFSANATDKKTIEREDREYKHDLPAQHETKATNHQTVPQPVIKNLGTPTKDRAHASSTDAGSQPISSDPGVDSRQAKDRANQELNSHMNPNAGAGNSAPVAVPVAAIPLSQSKVPTTGESAIPPATPAKTGIVSSGLPAPGVTPIVYANPGTPISADNRQSQILPATPSSIASTPQRSHLKESSAASGSDDAMRKRKSSFFGKVSRLLGTEPVLMCCTIMLTILVIFYIRSRVLSTRIKRRSLYVAKCLFLPFPLFPVLFLFLELFAS